VKRVSLRIRARNAVLGNSSAPNARGSGSPATVGPTLDRTASSARSACFLANRSAIISVDFLVQIGKSTQDDTVSFSVIC
jgi:hypothetical protein